MPATMKFLLELMTGGSWAVGGGFHWQFVERWSPPQRGFCQSTLDCKVAMKRGQIAQRNDILLTSIAALRRW